MKIRLIIFLFLLVQNIVCSQDTMQHKSYIYYPGVYEKGEYKMSIGISLTRLPNEIIEEEINTLPMLNADFNLSLPRKFSFHAKINANYISNMLSLALQKNIIDKKFALAIGLNSSIWYGHLYQDLIRLNAYGAILNPYIIGGIHFKDLYLSLKIENQYSVMKTISEDDAMLGKSFQPNSAYSFQFSIEQPLWNNNWVALGVKFNYAKFNYQAWLTYSAINEYMLYPEYSFTFIF
jgi:hypothetical protein